MRRILGSLFGTQRKAVLADNLKMNQDSLLSATDATVPGTVQTRAQVAPDKAFEVIVPIDLS